MAERVFLLGWVLLLLLLLSSVSARSGDPGAQYIYGGCSNVKYSSNSSYKRNLENALTSMVNSATFQPYNNVTVESSNPQEVVYGLYQCRGDIAMPDCAACVQEAVSQFSWLCPDQNCGGVIQMEGCFVKYDNDSFLSKQDKQVVMRKCGPTDGYDDQVKSTRDGVLAGLLNSGQLYRASASENIQSVAQCTGDLNPSQCQDCLTEAIRKVKQECFMAAYGDMFLGKCYVRYTINMVHAPSGKAHSMFSSNEKTFAIIAGLLAGIVLLIIFLMFLKKIFIGEKGK
uniref:Gnk2-homologous domain-containing protein n=1 Tax=Kalanchoe fedtschenkoi TaxID=63787 RepID=A0A7N0ZR26_KALFE